MALQPLFDAKVGRWQTASIPNRGTIDARRAIKRWARERSSKWFVKLDVRKCYPSIDRTTLKAMLTRDVGDPILLRLVFHLIDRYQGATGSTSAATSANGSPTTTSATPTTGSNRRP